MSTHAVPLSYQHHVYDYKGRRKKWLALCPALQCWERSKIKWHRPQTALAGEKRGELFFLSSSVRAWPRHRIMPTDCWPATPLPCALSLQSNPLHFVLSLINMCLLCLRVVMSSWYCICNHLNSDEASWPRSWIMPTDCCPATCFPGKRVVAHRPRGAVKHRSFRPHRASTTCFFTKKKKYICV